MFHSLIVLQELQENIPAATTSCKDLQQMPDTLVFSLKKKAGQF